MHNLELQDDTEVMRASLTQPVTGQELVALAWGLVGMGRVTNPQLDTLAAALLACLPGGQVSAPTTLAQPPPSFLTNTGRMWAAVGPMHGAARGVSSRAISNVQLLACMRALAAAGGTQQLQQVGKFSCPHICSAIWGCEISRAKL